MTADLPAHCHNTPSTAATVMRDMLRRDRTGISADAIVSVGLFCVNRCHCIVCPPVQSSQYTHTLRRTFGSGLRNSDCSSILSSAGLSADDHTPVQLDPIKMLLYTPTFDLSIFIWLSPSLIILSSSISTFISLSLYYSTLLFLVSLCVCVLLGRVKRLTDRKYSSSENSSLACMCSLK